METLQVDNLLCTLWDPIDAEHYDRNHPRRIMDHFALSASNPREIYGSISIGNAERLDYGLRRHHNVVMPLLMRTSGYRDENLIVLVKKEGVIQYYDQTPEVARWSNYKMENVMMRLPLANVYNLDAILRHRKLLALIAPD